MKNNIITVGIFFDGTGNNGINATASRKPQSNNESYYGNATNIYKMFGLFDGDEKIYIEGIGTVTDQEDSDFAMATCRNPGKSQGYSSDDKLEKAFSFIKNLTADKNRSYALYVYGFSRGAMLARHFCHELLKPEPAMQADITVKFLGVFDTVESSAFSEYNVTLLPLIEKALHLCSLNECRYFFPLTGFFEESRELADTKYERKNAVWKEIFVPGAHADVGGGYLEGSESVYISPDFVSSNELVSYVENIRETSAGTAGKSIWDHLLEQVNIERRDFFSQAYLERDLVYSEISRIYGRLMVKESNLDHQVFIDDFSESDFLIDEKKHPYLAELYCALEAYAENLSAELKPEYSYEKLVDYTHISANFGLFHAGLIHSKEGAHAEFINNGLNVPTHSDDQFSANQLKLRSEIHHVENSVVDYAYGMNTPNNDNWSRTILIKENLYNKC
ncbi:DUF2235 domain-containing protein [Chryseobacterium sp. JJR-5R]|uniref:T6SS phospholipase effector Tle1-like catalytic domain-containing protein n=1 Tax=Chryseobacterium sp. JJR-5R TaxID=3093923 RepID=UPI002A75A666|nr:DUF2235 domain-containing protein [Chryseobacterium sp. JJR-5R]WPO82092.1 DUF2235 domain-containing protein [Chryseobacterium sp. JJR-5R]